MYRVELPTERRVKSYLKNKSSEQIREDLYQAQMAIYEAWETDDEDKRVTLVKKALKKSPLCSDAYLLYLQYFNQYTQATAGILRFAVFMAEKGLIDPLSSFKGVFWGDIDTRPYMRAKAELAKCLWIIGQYEDSINEYEELLTLNPNDNQGIRYLLSAYYLELEKLDKLKKLLKKYQDDYSPFLSYNKALMAYKEKDKKAKTFALEAIQGNLYVIDFLMERIKPLENRTGFYSVGGEDEAQDYVYLNILNWLRAGNAIEWLVEVAQETGYHVEAES